jgi:predicted nucleic acid-binding protein
VTPHDAAVVDTNIIAALRLSAAATTAAPWLLDLHRDFIIDATR